MRPFMRFALVATGILATATLTPIAAGGASGAAGTKCSFSANVDLSPGLSAAPGGPAALTVG